MSKLQQVVAFAVVITLVVARFVLTANDSPDTILVPSAVTSSAVVERYAAPVGGAPVESVRFAIARS